MGGVAVDWFDLPVDVLAIGTTRPAIGDPTTDLDLVERALNGLSLADRTLHHVKHLSLVEIGERLGVPGKTVKSRLFSARRSLERADLRDDFRYSGSVRTRAARIVDPRRATPRIE